LNHSGSVTYEGIDSSQNQQQLQKIFQEDFKPSQHLVLVFESLTVK